MSSETHPRLVWSLPFFVSTLMACGSLIGISIVSNTALQDDPAGDIAGAAGALLFLICLLVGFSITLLTLIVTKLLHRPSPHQIVFRLGLSFLGGVIIGALGSNPGDLSTVATWLLLLGLPVLVIWPSCFNRWILTRKDNIF